MRRAVELGHYAIRRGQRGFGAVIFNAAGEEIGYGFGSETPTDPTAHSEMDAIREACAWRDGPLTDCTLYSTHEPCAMCCGAISHAKVSRVVWGSDRADLPELFRCRHYDAHELLRDTSHPPTIRTGVLRDECIALLRRADA